MNDIEVTDADNLFYLKMWGAMKMGIDPTSFRTMREEDLEMLMIVEEEMSRRNKRKSEIEQEMARVKRG